MAKNTIKGLTVEIGGDTTKLGKALEDVNKKGRDISKELGQINKLLKLDPSNTELLAQKQKVLGEAIANTTEELDTLKEAEKQVQEQFKRGEVSEEQVRALQREIIATEKKLESYQKEAEGAADQTEEIGEEAEEAGEKSGKFGEALKTAGSIAAKGFAVVASAATAAVGALVASAEASREYRAEMGKLEAAFTTAGHTSETATKTYKALQGVLGETDQAVEAANHLAKLCDNEEDLYWWTDICTGVYATFGASLPIEGLTEAANETAKTGQLTGALADALNWAGVSEEEFQYKLDRTSSAQERQTLIAETLNSLYYDAAKAYKELNAEVIRANRANEEWSATVAEVGGAVEPLLTDVKLLGASLLQDLVPGVTTAVEAFRGLMNGEEGAGAAFGGALSGLITNLMSTVTSMLPQVAEVGASLVSSLLSSVLTAAPQVMDTGVKLIGTLTNSLVSAAPQLLSTGVQLISSLLKGLTSAIPQVLSAAAEITPLVVRTLVEGTPLLISGALQLFLALCDAIPLLIEQLIPAIPTITMCIINTLLDAIPELLQGALKLLLAVCDAIPLLVEQLAPLIPEIVTTIILGLLDCIPDLISAALTLFFSIQKAIPEACVALLKSLPEIWTTMKGYFETLPGKLKEIGKSLVEGLWNGIKDKAAWLKEKISGWVGDVTAFLKRLFGINSPSKVTAWMGEMLDEGFAKGIEDNTKAPLDAMSDLSAAMLDEAGGVDGLAIERRIQHTFAAPTPGADAQAGLVGKLDQILEAIKSGQVLTINGDTLVGATANAMNSALGQRRVLAERGAV